jgi:hypothetical protein
MDSLMHWPERKACFSRLIRKIFDSLFDGGVLVATVLSWLSDVCAGTLGCIVDSASLLMFQSTLGFSPTARHVFAYPTEVGC